MTTIETVKTEGRPFSNGTEGYSWMDVWCSWCAHDHDASHHPDSAGAGCDLVVTSMTGEWPAEWTPEPPSLGHHLPPLILCDRFKPCHRGDCDGDPHTETRVEITTSVREAWAAEGEAVAS